jgi:lysophospholipase L1-like esterase
MKLNNIMQRFRHVTLIDTDLRREYNTKHGMHLNNKGKDEIARKMAKLINKVVIDEKKDTII